MPERSPQFAELERLLRQAGIVDDCSQRIVEEIQDHYDDLLIEARAAGIDSERANERAMKAIGAPAQIVAAAAHYRQLCSFSSRHPRIADFSRGLALAATVPALPIWYCAQKRSSIARWGAAVGLAVVMTAGLLLSLQSVLSS